MGIIIGDNNNINNSLVNDGKMQKEDRNWGERHPIIISALISFIVGFLLLFNFWKEIILFLEGLV